MHSRTTAREIVDDFKGEKLDYWVTGFGTGGTLKGVARVLRKERPDTKIVVCEPADAPMLSTATPQERNPDGSPAKANPAFKPHPMQGWSPDFIPKLTGDAVDMRRHRPHHHHRRGRRDEMQPGDLAQKEGIFVGITAGATFAGALEVCQDGARPARPCWPCCPIPASAICRRRCSPTSPADMTEEELTICNSTPNYRMAPKSA